MKEFKADFSSVPEIQELLDRVEKIEARQRAYKIHDPECAAFVPKNEGFQFDVYMKPQPCNCWLSEPTTTQKESNS